jgi:hypothetical protein
MPVRACLGLVIAAVTAGGALLGSSATAQSSDPLPSEIRGIWGLDGCSGEGDGLLVLTGTGAFAFERDKLEALDISLWSGPDEDSWMQASFMESKLFIRHIAEAQTLDFAFPAERGADNGPSGPPGAVPDPSAWNVITGQSCAGLPPQVQALYGETFAVLSAIDGAEGACAEGPEACADALFTALDVHPDGRFNIAELSRLIRVTAQIGLIENGAGYLDEQAALLAISIPLAPVLAHAVVNSFDYDGDEGLSLDELLGDRVVLTSDVGELLSGAGAQVDEMMKALESGASELGQLLMMLR